MKFSDIICPNTQIKGLEKSIYSNTVIQSLIFEGGKGTGKKSLADIYSMALLCESGEQKPCGKCKSCVLAMSGNHPDIFYIEKNDKKSIGVDEIKNAQKQAIIRPNESRRKVFIIKEADIMTPQAQNALLKLMEEPPSYLSIILLCENTMPLLDTIISRCTIIPMPYLSYDNVVEGLAVRGVDKERAKILAQGANGSLGLAMQRHSDSDKYIKNRDDLIEIFFMMANSKTKAYQEATKKIDRIKEMIGLWQSVVRDALMHESKEIDNIENIDKINKIEIYAQSHRREELINALDALCEAEKRLYYNTQNKLVLDYLITKIQ